MASRTAPPGEPVVEVQKCLIVIPCYNEAARLDLECFSEFLATKPQIDFLFVDDGSRDQTLKMLQDIQVRFPRVQVLALSPNGGKLRRYGAACSARSPKVDMFLPASGMRILLPR